MPFFGLFGPPDVEKLKAKRDIKGLIKALSYKNDWGIQVRAAEALGQLGDTRAAEPLISILRDPASRNTQLRSTAVDALAQLGDAQVVKLLITLAEDDTLVEGKFDALDALEKIRDARAVEPLIAALQSESRFVRQAAATALGEIGDVRAVEPLKASLQEYSNAVAEALAKFGAIVEKPSIPQEKRDSAQSDAPQAPLHVGEKRSTEVSAGGLQSSSKQDRHEHPEVTKRIADLKHSDWFVRRVAAEKLGEIGDVRAVEPLIEVVLDKDLSVRESAVDALKKLKPNWVKLKAARQVIATFIAALKDGDTFGRERAAQMLGRLGDAYAVEPLILALADKVQEVQRYAAEALTRIDPSWMKSKAAKQAVPSLIAALSAEDNDTQRGAAQVLGQIGDARAVEPLITALVNVDWTETKKHTEVEKQRQLIKWEVQHAVIRALGDIADVRAVKPLVALLTGNQFSTEGTTFMAQFYTDYLIDALQKLLQRRGSDVVSEDLFQIAHLPTLNIIRLVGDACGDAVTSQASIDCSDLRQLARQELIRRGEQV